MDFCALGLPPYVHDNSTPVKLTEQGEHGAMNLWLLLVSGRYSGRSVTG